MTQFDFKPNRIVSVEVKIDFGVEIGIHTLQAGHIFSDFKIPNIGTKMGIVIFLLFSINKICLLAEMFYLVDQVLYLPKMIC